MRLVPLFAVAVFALGCAHAELLRLPGVTDPAAPLDEAGLGLVRYATEGSRSVQQERRTDAYLEMHDACRGETEVVRETNDVPGWRFLHFRCRGPALHPSEMPDDQKPCCWSVGRPCSDT